MDEKKLITMIKDGVEIPFSQQYLGEAEVYTTTPLDRPHTSVHARGVEPFRAAIWVDKDGIVEDRSVTAALRGGEPTQTELTDAELHTTSDDFALLVLDGGEYTLKNIKVSAPSQADGKTTNDFSGIGALVNCWAGSKLVMENVEMDVTGCIRPCVFVDNNSHVLVKNSHLHSLGGTNYEGCRSVASISDCASVPWVLGLTGNCRATQLMGNCASATYVNCDIASGNWGALSTDNGADVTLTLIDSRTENKTMDEANPYTRRFGSGYASYIISNARERFYGAQLNAGTYIGICRGGHAEYRSSNGTFSITPMMHVLTGRPKEWNFYAEEWLEPFDTRPETKPVFEGIEGKGQITVARSDGFGWMAHGSDNEIVVTDGTVVETDSAVFLHKAGNVRFVIDNAKVSSADKVLVQLIDDDDLTVGNFGADEDWGPVFNTDFYEKAGWPGIDYRCDGFAGANSFEGHFSNVTLEGDIFNGSGYFLGRAGDTQQGRPLTVTLGENAILTGAAASTSCIHVNEKGEQNTHFTVEEYYYLGRVANRPHYNGVNDVHMVLTDNAVWNVSGVCLLRSLTIGENARVVLADGLTATLDGEKIILAPGMKLEGCIEIR